MKLSVTWRDESGTRLAMACWHPGPGYRMISSGVLGGGIGPRQWVLNAQVPGRYSRTDPAGHLLELAGGPGLTGPGVGMLTAAPAGAADPELAPGTINIIVCVPVPLADAALVNAVITDLGDQHQNQHGDHPDPLSGGPGTLALTPDGSQLWVCGITSAILTVLDTANDSTVGSLNLGGAGPTPATASAPPASY